MFTGLIQDIGTLHRRKDKADGDVTLWIETSLNLNDTAIGASIACDGVCLTVTEIEKSSEDPLFRVDVSNETLFVTTLGKKRVGNPLNLEPSLRMGDELGGHLVSGHVDAMTRCLERAPDGDSVRFSFKLSPDHTHLIAPKGSVTINGVSLTVNTVKKDTFDVNIIPHTLEKTTFSEVNPGDELNLEIDMLARYVSRHMQIIQE